MLLHTLLFYLFAGMTVLSGILVISMKNPVHTVLFLILAFFNAAGLFILLGAEFLGMTLVIVYVGAVAVLFLFVVMMLDINIAAMRQGFLRYLPIGLVVALVLFADLYLMLQASLNSKPVLAAAALPIPPESSLSNTHALGMVLYTHYFFPFQLAGLILLVAMIGSIVLTLRTREGVKKQRAGKQIGRTRAAGVKLVNVTTGAGIDGITRS